MPAWRRSLQFWLALARSRIAAGVGISVERLSHMEGPDGGLRWGGEVDLPLSTLHLICET
jgi:hypothetical protein